MPTRLAANVIRKAVAILICIVSGSGSFPNGRLLGAVNLLVTGRRLTTKLVPYTGGNAYHL
jgi:hypothetical protein